jgi:hypothetical protein
MTSESRWNRYQGQVVCYCVRIKHPLFRFPGLGPFPSAVEAGQAIDRLQAYHPSAEIVLTRIGARELPDWSNEYLDKQYECNQLNLDLALGEILPFSVLESVEVSPCQVTREHAEEVAERLGCPAGEIVVVEGARGAEQGAGKVWILLRRHLETESHSKALTKALWLQREMIQQGKADTETICVMAYPFSVPAQGNKTQFPRDVRA